MKIRLSREKPRWIKMKLMNSVNMSSLAQFTMNGKIFVQ